MHRQDRSDSPALVFNLQSGQRMVGKGKVDLSAKQGIFYTEQSQLLLDADHYFGEYQPHRKGDEPLYVALPITVTARRFEPGRGSVLHFVASGQPGFFADRDAFFKWQIETRRKMVRR